MKPKHLGDNPQGQRRDRGRKAALSAENTVRGGFWVTMIALLVAAACFSHPAQAETLVRGIISENTTWRRSESPYIVTADITVRGTSTAAAVLTVEPGVVVRFMPGTGLTVGYSSYKGALDARGTVAEPIVFTSNADAPAPGDWKALRFYDAAEDESSVLENCVVEYGGAAYNSSVYCYYAAPTIRSSVVRFGGGHGVRLYYSTPILEGNQIVQNREDGIYGDSGSAARIADNVLLDNGGSGLNLYPDSVRLTSGNSGSGNGRHGFEVRGGHVGASGVWAKQPLPYVVSGDITVRGTSTAAAVLTVEPGVEVRFMPGTGLTVGLSSYKGSLDARGTETEPIVFTSNAVAPAPGDWKALCFYDATDDESSVLENCVVEYGGATYNSSIYCYYAAPTIRHSLVQFSAGHGIRLYYSAPTLEGNEIGGNALDGIYGDSGSRPQIMDNVLLDNGGSGLNLYPDSVRLTSGNSGSGNGRHGFEVRGGHVGASGLWAKQPLPYVVGGDVTVRGSASETVRLTVESGTEMRFAAGSGLFVGYGSYKGALLAQGTAAAPIVFTSDAAAPAPGDWKSIYFGDATDAALSVLEHCVVEYGGATYNANIYCYAAAPTIQFNTIRNSRHAGLYLYGKGSDNAVITCNNFKDNPYGVYLAGGATTAIQRNNFLRNQTSGIHNTGSGEVHAENNWWGDDAGPGHAGDAVSGQVTAAPWLTAQADCIDLPPTNSPPFIPQNPFPANGAVRVPIRAEGEALAVALTWSGGDPNPWDTVVYDVFMGESSDSLSMLASGIEYAEFSRTDLVEGTHYFWRVVSRDDAGLETPGPIWRFTTLGDAPDLTVSGVVLQPASDIEAGQVVTIAAEVQNSGSGPVVDPFWVDFSIDDQSIGKIKITEVLPAGGVLTASRNWTAMVGGDRVLAVSADSSQLVAEESDENNTLWQPLPTVVDTTPPEVSHADPADGASRAQVERISFTLLDRYGGSVDTAAVSASVAVSDDGGGLVDGALAAAGNRFTFTPAVAPLADGRYRVAFTAVDTAGNARDHAVGFTVDGEAPGGLTITGGVVASGLLQVRPTANRAKSGSITLTGTREDLTSVWVNSQRRVAVGTGDWSTVLYLPEGESALEVWLQDAAGNRSASVWVDLLVDSVAPAVRSLLPADGSFLKLAPAAIAVEFEEATSGLDLAACLLALHDDGQQSVAGDWAAAGDRLSFLPQGELAESSYTITLQLQDGLGNRGAAVQSHFTVDATPPPAPALDPVVSPTPAITQAIRGTKEAHAAVLLNGAEVVGHTPETTWACTANLVSGPNRLTFLARDRAGNQSQGAAVEIVCDDLPPPAVSALTADGRGSGTTVGLSWAGYDEAAHGDVSAYRIYHETRPFADVSGLSVRTTVAAGQFAWRAEGLAKGTTYWFALVAVDRLGNALTAVSPVSAAPSDGVAPEDVAGLAVSAHDDRLRFTWQPSVDSASDLAGYRVFFNGAAEGEALSAEQTAFEIGGLSPATAYPFRICALDHDGNLSAGVSLTGITLLENPLGLSADAHSGAVDLVWQGVQPAAYVKHYRVYVSQSAFSTVAGMSPVFATGATSARVAGLTDNIPYWFAVTTVNLAGGERLPVAPVSVTPLQDTQGPQITSVRVGETPLAAGHRLERSATITAAATDPAGVSRVTFSLDGVVLAVAYTPPYSGFFDITSIEDGNHIVSVTAHDTLGNSTTLEFPIQIVMAPPQAPRITHPLGGAVTSQPAVTVAGRAEKGTAIRLNLNGAPHGSPAAVDLQGHFSIRVALVEGENRLWAAAENRAGIGPASPEVRVTLDTTLPRSPLGLSAQARAGGVVRLAWQMPPQETAAGYSVYRSAQPFAAVASAETVTAKPITALVFDDLPPEDGTWYYRVAAVDGAANQSPPSNQAAAASDGTPPRALAIHYAPQGSVDPDTGVMAPGKVLVELTVSEALQALPFLSITPEGGIPLAVELHQATETLYSGAFTIFETTPTATAYAVFSARDRAGNRGTEIDAGASIAIDTAGPAVIRLSLAPSVPIKNDVDDPVTVTLDLGLNEPLKVDTLPLIECRLSGEGRPPLPVASLREIAAQPGDRQRWQAGVALPADAGLGAPETLVVTYLGRDGLENSSDRILCPNRFQIYQGGLPPLSPPEGVAATALAGGRIRLSWQAVDGAAGYELYRQAPGEDVLTVYQRCTGVLEWIDDPGGEGLFRYAVASIREENGETAESALSSPPVEAWADATRPEAPFDLVLELSARGVRAAWQPPADTEALTYRLYRSDAAFITTVAGLSPVITGIVPPTALDSRPSLTEHSYAVTAVDAAGNESEPSDSAYLNAGLLPVATLAVVQTDSEWPVVSWTHPGGDVAGYDIYLGTPGEGIKLNTALLTASTFTDAGFNDDDRVYTLVAVDASAAQSLGRTLSLPLLRASLGAEVRLKRGVMNRLVYRVENRSAAAATQVRLKVALGGREHLSEAFAVGAGAAVAVPVTVGGYGDLSDSEALVTTLEITPHEGESVRIVRTSEISVDDGALVLQILNDPLTRGGAGQVRFALTNTGDAAIEIVTARSAGQAASDEITFYLVDADDNVLSTAAFKQALGGGVVTLANGASVARIGAGETFTSEAVALPVPANAPDAGVIRLEIEGIYYHLGQDGEVVMAGPGTRHGVTLADTAYVGEVTDISPQISTGDQTVVISGRALARDSGQPLPHVSLNLIISLNGFERSVAVFTAADGTFSHGFTPLAGEGGTYGVAAVHPDVTDRPLQGQFVISRLAVSPTAASLNLPKNYPQRIALRATAGDGSEIRNLQLIWAATDQPQGILPRGIHLTPEAPVAVLGPRQTAELAFSVWADNTAAQNETLVMTVQSDGEKGPIIWARVVISAHFSQAAPYLAVSPHHLETGVALEASATETLVLSNKGTADISDLLLSLVTSDGAPAPGWVQLNSAADLGTLAVGESREVTLTFAPAATVSEGNYTFQLRAQGANLEPADTQLFATVTQNGSGSVLCKVYDIYTGTIDPDTRQPVQGLEGARVALQHETVASLQAAEITDGGGEALFSDLPAGRYKCRITAPNHQETISRISIKPGITAVKEVFLEYNLVTVAWSVTETTIADRYDIVLSATFETDVPAAVVVAEPASLTLPEMRAGDVLNGEFTLSNYGLVRADGLKIILPQDDRHFRYEILGGLPEQLGAKERISVPYRLTCLAPLNPDEDGEASGGGCFSYFKAIRTLYSWICANGVWSGGSTRHAFTYAAGSGCGGGGGSVYWSGIPYGDGSAGSGGGTRPETFIGQCLPDPPKSPCAGDVCCAAGNEGEQNQRDETAPEVNMLSREYTTDAVDIAVKVPGGAVAAGRSYRGFSWGLSHDKENLDFEYDDLDGTLAAIEKGGVRYTAASPGANVFKNQSYLIKKEATGFRWEDKLGNWQAFDDTGRLAAYGNRKGTIARMVYEPLADGKLLSYADRNGLTVLSMEYDDQGRLCGIADNNGRRVGYSYSGERLVEVTDVRGNRQVFDYDAVGRISRTLDDTGRTRNITYNTYGYVTSVLDDEGRGSYFEYDYDKLRQEYYARITSTTGREKEVWYDRDGKTRRVDINGRTVQKIERDGRTLLVTDEKGHTTRKTFDQWGNLTTVVHPDGATETTAYEHTFNKPVQKTDPNGIVTRYEYDDAGNTIRTMEAAGTAAERVSEYAYDADNNRTVIRRLGDGQTAETVTSKAYDVLGNMISLTDPEGNITRFTHDPMGNVLTQEDPRGKLWRYEYNAAGLVTTIIDPLNQETRFEYDPAGHRVKMVDPEGIENAFAYDARGNLISATNGAGEVARFEYNAIDQLTRQVDPEGKALVFHYDPDGRLAQSIDGNGNVIAMDYEALYASCAGCSGGGQAAKPSKMTFPTFTREYRYDKRGRKTFEMDVLGPDQEHMTRFVHDAAGRIVERTDKEDNVTRYVYDELDRLVLEVDTLGHETQYIYDARDNLIELVDANGGATGFEYDRNDRLIREIRPEGQETRYGYDPAGNLIEKIDAKNQKTVYSYGEAGRLVETRHHTAADWNTAVKTVRYTYDRIGNLIGYHDGLTAAFYTFDEAHRKIAETLDYGPFSLSYGYEYYANGMKKSFTAPDGTTYHYTYDANNQLTGVALPGAGFITVNAHRWNRPEHITLPGGGSRRYDYDPLMRISSITVEDSAQKGLMDYRYTYDRMDNITAKDTEHGLYSYGYDALYQLLAAANPRQDEAFTYDPVGNRLTVEGVAGAWRYNPNNELVGYGDVAFDYDANGNMIRKTADGRVLTYNYNTEDRLVRVEEFGSAVIAQYYYDPFGRRLWKDVDGVRTYFLYSDEGLIGEYDVAGGEIKAYGWKPGSTWTTDPLFMKIGGAYYFFHNDHLGTPQKITAVTGGVVWSANYTSFLKADLSPSCSITNNLRAPGQYFDQETGLHYNRFRFYDPKAGRYLRTDPVGIEGGINLYAYVSNNPVNWFDYNGLDAIVLLDREGAYGAGHLGIAIGNDTTGWEYYSQDGPRHGGGHKAPYGSLKDLLSATKIADRYDLNWHIKSTPCQDQDMLDYAEKNYQNSYSANPLNPHKYHCADLVTGALNAGGINTGGYSPTNIPKIRYHQTVMNNL